MTPELKLKFQQEIYNLHVNSSVGVDEKNIEKLVKICDNLYNIAERLYCEVYPDSDTGEAATNIISFDKEENDVVEATAELNTKVKAHRPEAK
jgi:hypothetical protein